jgi:hypothetical protein
MCGVTRLACVLAASAVAILLAPPLSGHGGSARGDRVGQGPSGTLMLLSTNRLTSIDVRSGRRRVRRAPLASCGPELAVTGGYAIFAGVRKRRTVVFSVPISLDAPPRRLGGAHAFVASATEGRVWLAGVDCNQRKMAGVREVTVDGRVTFRSHRRVPGFWLAGAVGPRLVVLRGRGSFLWDPTTGRTGGLSLDAVLDVQGDLMAGCTMRCRRLVIFDSATGGKVVARPQGRYTLDSNAELSPDGSLLATPALADRRWSVALVDTRTGKATIVPGSRTGADYPDPKWAASTGWLFFRAAEGRIMAYRPGEPRAVPLPFRMPRRTVTFVAG